MIKEGRYKISDEAYQKLKPHLEIVANTDIKNSYGVYYCCVLVYLGKKKSKQHTLYVRCGANVIAYLESSIKDANIPWARLI